MDRKAEDEILQCANSMRPVMLAKGRNYVCICFDFFLLKQDNPEGDIFISASNATK